MNRELLSKAFGDLDESFVLEAYCPVPEDASSVSERIVHMKKKRIITFALAAVLMLALGLTAYAVGISYAVATHRMKDTGSYSTLSDLPKAEAVTGYPICLVERFSNGYAFSGMRVDGEAVYDESYNILEEYYVVHATYTSPENDTISLNLSPIFESSKSQDHSAPTRECLIGKTEVKISRDHYKFVPENYEKTKEDLAAETAGHFYVSFGSDRIEEKDIVSADFELNGVHYDFLSMDATTCTDETLIQMASEIIEAANA